MDVAFLGASQIDRYGNLNSTVIGDYDDPAVRLGLVAPSGQTRHERAVTQVLAIRVELDPARGQQLNGTAWRGQQCAGAEVGPPFQHAEDRSRGVDSCSHPLALFPAGSGPPSAAA